MESLAISHESLRAGWYRPAHMEPHDGEMEANDFWRERARRLLKLGINQKVIAAKIGMTPSTFNRWLHGSGADDMSVNEAQRLQAYEKELYEALRETQRPADDRSGTAGSTFHERKTRRSESNDARHA